MNDENFEKLKKSLIEVQEFTEGKRRLKSTTRRKRHFIEPRHFGADDIKAVRKKTDLSQGDLADVLGVKRKTVQAWESDKNTPAGSSARLLGMINDRPGLLKDLVDDTEI